MGPSDLARGRDQWSTLVTAAVNLRFRNMLGGSAAAAYVVASQQGLKLRGESFRRRCHWRDKSSSPTPTNVSVPVPVVGHYSSRSV
jgi:hypothetical protein